MARTIHIRRVGQNRISAPYMTVYMVISLLKIPCIPINVWFWPALHTRYIYYGISGREVTNLRRYTNGVCVCVCVCQPHTSRIIEGRRQSQVCQQSPTNNNELLEAKHHQQQQSAVSAAFISFGSRQYLVYTTMSNPYTHIRILVRCPYTH